MFGLVSSESCFFYFETSILGALILLPSTWYLSSLLRWMASNNTIVHHCTAPTPTKTSGPLSRSANGSFPIKYTRRKRGGSLHVARNWRCNDSIVIKLLCPLTLPTVPRFPLVPTGNVFSNNMHITATMTSLPNCFFLKTTGFINWRRPAMLLEPHYWATDLRKSWTTVFRWVTLQARSWITSNTR